MPDVQPSPSTKKSSKWLYLVLPANIAYGPLSTLIVLYILQLGGTVLNVAYAITLASAVMIPAAFFWGKITDMFNKRKTQILISYFGLAISLLLLLFAHDIASISVIYAIAVFMMAANSTPLNLLIMERAPSQKWASLFAKLQMVSSLGATIGYVIAVAVTGFASLYYLTILLFFISVISIVFTKLYLEEAPIKFTARNIIRNSFAIVARAIVHPIFIAIIPRPSLIKKLFFSGRLSDPNKRYLTALFVASFFFYIGSSVFNTVYPAGLQVYGLSKSGIFLVMFVGIAAQTLTFNSYSAFEKRIKRPRLISRSLILRGLSYALIGVAFAAFHGAGFLTANLILYALTSGVAYSIFYATWSTLVFENLGNTDRGTAIGVYNGVTGLATLLGALISGYVSFYGGYLPTFGLAAGLMLVSLLVYLYRRKKEAPSQPVPLVVS